MAFYSFPCTQERKNSAEVRWSSFNRIVGASEPTYIPLYAPVMLLLVFPPYESSLLGSELLYCQHIQAADCSWKVMKFGLLTSVQIDVI